MGNLNLIKGAETSWRVPDGQIFHHGSDLLGEIACPPAFDDVDSDPEPTRLPKRGASVITAARLGNYGGTLEAGSHTSDLAMLAMMDKAKSTIKVNNFFHSYSCV